MNAEKYQINQLICYSVALPVYGQCKLTETSKSGSCILTKQWDGPFGNVFLQLSMPMFGMKIMHWYNLVTHYTVYAYTVEVFL